jgi:ribosomal protein S21
VEANVAERVSLPLVTDQDLEHWLTYERGMLHRMLDKGNVMDLCCNLRDARAEIARLKAEIGRWAEDCRSRDERIQRLVDGAVALKAARRALVEWAVVAGMKAQTHYRGQGYAAIAVRVLAQARGREGTEAVEGEAMLLIESAEYKAKQAIDRVEQAEKVVRLLSDDGNVVSAVVELNALRAFKRTVDEALNSGDGSYRP